MGVRATVSGTFPFLLVLLLVLLLEIPHCFEDEHEEEDERRAITRC